MDLGGEARAISKGKDASASELKGLVPARPPG